MRNRYILAKRKVESFHEGIALVRLHTVVPPSVGQRGLKESGRNALSVADGVSQSFVALSHPVLLCSCSLRSVFASQDWC